MPTYGTAPRSTMDHHPEVIDLHVVIPEEDGEFFSQLHEDDGISEAFSAGAFLRTTFCLTRRHDRIQIASTVAGKGYPEFRRRMFRLFFLGCSVDKIEVRGGDARVENRSAELENRGEAFELSFVVPRPDR